MPYSAGLNVGMSPTAVIVCICRPGASAHIMSPGVIGSHEPIAAFLERESIMLVGASHRMP